MALDRWHLITGEYPPQPGGVADYTELVAAALARAGAEVHVWTSGGSGARATDGADGVVVHRPVGSWRPGELARLDKALDAFARPRRLLVQYAPGVWGCKGLNIAFCRWLVERRARGDDVRVMFHEVWYPLRLRDRPRRWLLALGQRLMARTLMRACSTAYVSIPAWEPLLRTSEPRGEPPRPLVWLPVPSNVPVVDDATAVAGLRRRLAPGGETIVGSFGTFGGLIGSLLVEVLPRVLGPGRVGLLFGRGSDRFAAELVARHPELNGRLHAAGGLPAGSVSIHLQACDLVVQPYPDGLSSRRGTLMAALAHGVAAVSNLGVLSEPVWAQTGGVALAAEASAGGLAEAAERLIASPETRAALGSAGLQTYRCRFAVERTVEALQGLGAASPSFSHGHVSGPGGQVVDEAISARQR